MTLLLTFPEKDNQLNDPEKATSPSCSEQLP